MSQEFSSEEEVTFAASVATGLEKVAASEVEEKLGFSKDDGKVITGQGRVYITTLKESLPLLHNLKSVDRLFLIVKTYSNYLYKDSKEETYADLTEIAKSMPWSEIIKLWEFNTKFWKPKSRQKNMSKSRNSKTNLTVPNSTETNVQTCTDDFSQITIDKHDETKSDSSIPLVASNGELIRFRVTSNRVGKKQPVTSPEASYAFGGQIQDFTHWKVDLSNFNLEILLSLGENSLQVSIALTLQSLHRRNITHFGITTLRPTTAYCMLRACKIEPGDIVFDPMCGSGAIPVEGSLEWPHSFHIGGDIVKGAVIKCNSNIRFINENPEFIHQKFLPHSDQRKKFNLPADVVRWDVTNLPVKSNYVDVIVSDLPFGKRVGSKVDNRILYPATLKEMARISKCGTGRACLLTQDKRTMKRVLDSMMSIWKVTKTLHINIGGLTAGIFLMKRTTSESET